MSNFIFGNLKCPDYDTISGGSGAGSVTDSDYELASGFNGPFVVQANMTNLRLTNLEILVFRFRVRLDQQPGPHQPGRHAAQLYVYIPTSALAGLKAK